MAFLSQNKANLACFFLEKRQFLHLCNIVENRRKLIVIITSTSDWANFCSLDNCIGTYFEQLFENYWSSPYFRATEFPVEVMHSFWQKMVWATLWALFLQTHLVTLQPTRRKKLCHLHFPPKSFRKKYVRKLRQNKIFYNALHLHTSLHKYKEQLVLIPYTLARFEPTIISSDGGDDDHYTTPPVRTTLYINVVTKM
jgi:hypothetical protein